MCDDRLPDYEAYDACRVRELEAELAALEAENDGLQADLMDAHDQLEGLHARIAELEESLDGCYEEDGWWD